MTIRRSGGLTALAGAALLIGLTASAARAQDAVGEALAAAPTTTWLEAVGGCPELPRRAFSRPLEGSRLVSDSCVMAGTQRIPGDSPASWVWLRLRRTLIYEVAAAAGDTPARVDTLVEDELVVFSGNGGRDAHTSLRPVWRDRVDARFEAIMDPAIMRLGDRLVLVHRRCLVGTGGCRDRPFLLDADSAVRPLVPAYATQIRDTLLGRHTRMAERILLDPLLGVARTGAYLPGDPESSSSFVATAALRLVGETVNAGPVKLFPAPTSLTWLVDPEHGAFGPIGRSTSKAELEARVGAALVEPASIYLGEGVCAPGSVVFPGSPHAIEVAWADEGRTRPAFVRFIGTTGPWQTPGGVEPGMSIGELARLQGSPFEFSAFGWDYGGGAVWTGDGKNLRLGMGVPPDDYQILRRRATEQPEGDRLFGDHSLRSDDPLLEGIRIRIETMSLEHEHPVNTFDCG